MIPIDMHTPQNPRHSAGVLLYFGLILSFNGYATTVISGAVTTLSHMAGRTVI